MRKTREVKIVGGIKLYKCSSCGGFLSRENFSKNLSGYDFISSECKKCGNERMKRYRKENKEKRNAYQRDYKERRRMMMEAQFGETQQISNYVPIPQPIPQPVELPKIEKPIKTVQPPKSKFSNWLEKLEQENAEAQEQEQKQDDELIVQSAIEKYPDAYTEILSDEDTLYYFNEKRSIDKKIEELQRRQEKYDKQKAEREYNIMKEKMRDLVDETLDDKQKKNFEYKLNSLHEEQQDEFVKKVSRLSKASFPVSREAIFDALLDIQTGKIKNKDVLI